MARGGPCLDEAPASLLLVVCPPWVRTPGKIIVRPWASHFPFCSLCFPIRKTQGGLDLEVGQPQPLSNLHLRARAWGGGKTPQRTVSWNKRGFCNRSLMGSSASRGQDDHKAVGK